MSEYVSVDVLKVLFNDIQRKVDESEGVFNTVEEYIEFILTEVIKKEDDIEAQFTPEEEEKLKERLKNLGYI